MTANPGQAPIPVATSHAAGPGPGARYQGPVGRVPHAGRRRPRRGQGEPRAWRPARWLAWPGRAGRASPRWSTGRTRLLRAPALVTSGSVTYAGRRVTKPVDLLRLRPDELQRLRWREIAIVFQSAMNALNPVLNVRDQLLDVIHAHLRMPRDEARERAGVAARPGGHPAVPPAQLPARAVRRHAPAGDDRDGAGHRPRGRDHGRADHRARRGGAARHPGPDRGAQGAARLLHRVHHARPVPAARAGRPDRGDVRRAVARDRHGRGDPPRAVAPLHQGPAQLVPLAHAARAAS